jgi:hypothetical protein
MKDDGISDGIAGISTCLEEHGVIDRLIFNLGSDIPTSSQQKGIWYTAVA